MRRTRKANVQLTIVRVHVGIIVQLDSRYAGDAHDNPGSHRRCVVLDTGQRLHETSPHPTPVFEGIT